MVNTYNFKPQFSKAHISVKMQQYKQPTRCNNNGLLIIPISSTCFGRKFRPSSRALDCVYSLWYNAPTMLPAGSIVGALYHKL